LEVNKTAEILFWTELSDLSNSSFRPQFEMKLRKF
jgi:hypothetical protein